MSKLPKAIRDNLVCPICRGELVDRKRGLYCETDTRLYPVVNGVAHMTLEDSIKTKKPDEASR